MNKASLKEKVSRVLQGTAGNFGLAVTREMVALGRPRRFDIDGRVEFVRLSSLELVAQEIYERGVEGSVAELGVYQGEFAKIINQAFPDRELHLFDTFDGFDVKDVTEEQAKNYSSGEQDFSDTSTELVLAKMPHRDKCVVRKGYFPDTAQDLLDAKYAFVSIDTDLYSPILSGLQFFYPRLNPGGYIFVHDYNDAAYPGAKDAVREFCRSQGINFFPLSDGWGTAVIMK